MFGTQMKHHKIQVEFEFGFRPLNFQAVMTPFSLFNKYGFRIITVERGDFLKIIFHIYMYHHKM